MMKIIIFKIISFQLDLQVGASANISTHTHTNGKKSFVRTNIQFKLDLIRTVPIKRNTNIALGHCIQYARLFQHWLNALFAKIIWQLSASFHLAFMPWHAKPTIHWKESTQIISERKRNAMQLDSFAAPPKYKYLHVVSMWLYLCRSSHSNTHTEYIPLLFNWNSRSGCLEYVEFHIEI